MKKFVTSCCASEDILQDAYVNPNYPNEVASSFDDFICDNEECESYGSECWCNEIEVEEESDEHADAR